MMLKPVGLIQSMIEIKQNESRNAKRPEPQ